MHTQVLIYKYTASTVFTGFVYTGRKKSDHFCILVLLLYNVYKMRTLTYKNLMFCSIVDQINYCKLITRASANHSEEGNMEVGVKSRCLDPPQLWMLMEGGSVIDPHSWLSCSQRSSAAEITVASLTNNNALFFPMLKFKMGLQSLPSMLLVKTATLVQGYKAHISMFCKKAPFQCLTTLCLHFLFQTPDLPLPLYLLLP